MHEQTEVKYITDYIKEISNHFYNNKLGINELTKNITSIRSYNLPFKNKHKLPYQYLDIFHEVA